MPVSWEEVRPEFEALLAGLLDGRLETSERERLFRILRESSDARRMYLDFCQMHAILVSAHGVLQAFGPPVRRRSGGFAAVAAAVLMALGVAFWVRSASAPWGARFEPAEGSAWIVRDGRRVVLSESRPVREGDRYVTGSGARAVVRRDDGSTIVLLERTDVAFRADRVELNGGALRCEIVPHGDRSLVFLTPNAEATVLGTAFELSAVVGETRVRTGRGRVRLAAEERSVEIGAGQVGVADGPDLFRWEPALDLNFSALKELPPAFTTHFCFSDALTTSARAVAPAPERVRLVPGGLTFGPPPDRPARNGLIELRWSEEVGDDVMVEAEVAGAPRWSLGMAVSGSSFEGYRIIFAAIQGYDNGVAVDTLHPAECIVLAKDPKPIAPDEDHTLRVERRGTRMKVWVDRELRIDTEIDHPLPPARRRTVSLSNFGAPPLVKSLRVWKLGTPRGLRSP
ncbi:MAG TPA: FecR family protein [Planctomycetota bacterium]|nr:FecR family protein [Planctomycetota bacterium]